MVTGKAEIGVNRGRKIIPFIALGQSDFESVGIADRAVEFNGKAAGSLVSSRALDLQAAAWLISNG